jgi:DNA-binding MurR/RpiR family transcriptional regulator
MPRKRLNVEEKKIIAYELKNNYVSGLYQVLADKYGVSKSTIVLLRNCK